MKRTSLFCFYALHVALGYEIGFSLKLLGARRTALPKLVIPISLRGLSGELPLKRINRVAWAFAPPPALILRKKGDIYKKTLCALQSLSLFTEYGDIVHYGV